MTEQPPRSTREKVRHQYSCVIHGANGRTARDLAGAAIEKICRESLLKLLEYVPAGEELDQALLRHREAFLWFTHAVLVNPSDNSTADGKLVEEESRLL